MLMQNEKYKITCSLHGKMKLCKRILISITTAAFFQSTSFLTTSSQNQPLPRNGETLTLITMLNKAGYTATPVACGWAGAVQKVTRAFGQEQWAQKAQKHRKSKSQKCEMVSGTHALPK